MSVIVQVPSAAKPITVPISSTQSKTSPIFHIKRSVATALALDPLQFRLESVSKAFDSVQVPQVLRFVQRAKRNTSIVVNVGTPSSAKCIYTLKLDPEDTICDAKFVIGALANVLPEVNWFYESE
jgi:hypothetical protein